MRSLDVPALVSVGAERASRAQGHDDQAHSRAENLFGRQLVVETRVDPGQVRLTRLDDRALRDRTLETLAVFRVGYQPPPAVRIEHHPPPAPPPRSPLFHPRPPHPPSHPPRP